MSSLKKLRKLILHPVRFFRDARGKRDQPIFPAGFQGGNLFVVSHLNQLIQVQSLIRFERFSNNRLLILSTPANKVMPRTIHENVHKGLFEAVAELQLPRSPNVVRLDRLNTIAGLYRKVLRQLRPTSVFLLSFERHYAILGKFAVDQGAGIFLVEEGTATYKIGQDGENLAHIDPKGGNRFSIAAIEHLPFYRHLRPALGRIQRFSGVYAAFPGLLRHAFQFERATRFFMHAGGLSADPHTRKQVAAYGITSRDALFVSQRYPIRDVVFIGAIMRVLAAIVQQDEGRIFLKLHPKDRPAVPKAFADEIRLMGLQGRIVLLKEADFLIEPAIAVARPRAVYGLTSTALVYAPLVSPCTKTYSLLPWVTQNVKSHPAYTPAQDDVSVMESHFSILAQFSHVRVLDGQAALGASLTVPGEPGDARTQDAFWLRCAERNLDEALALGLSLGAEFERRHQPCLAALASLARQEPALSDHLHALFAEDPVAWHVARGISAWGRADYESAAAILDEALRMPATEATRTGYARVFLASSLRLSGAAARAMELLQLGWPEDIETPFGLYEMAQLSLADGNTAKYFCYVGWTYPEGVGAMPAPLLDQYATVALADGRGDLVTDAWHEYVRRLHDPTAPGVLTGNTFDAMYGQHHRAVVARQGLWAGFEDARRWRDLMAERGMVAPRAMACLRMESLVLSQDWAGCRDEILHGREQLAEDPRYGFLAMYGAIHANDPALFGFVCTSAPAAWNEEPAMAMLEVWRHVLLRDWQAVLDAAQALAPSPDSCRELRYELACARACRELGDHDGAKRWLIAYERHSKGDACGLIELVRLTLATGQWGRTVQYLEHVYCEERNMPADLLLAYLDGLIELKQWGKALSAMPTARERLPDEAVWLGRLVRVLMAMGRHEEVVAECRQAILLPPDVAWMHAQALRATGQTAAAHEAIHRAGRDAATVEEWALRAEVSLLQNRLQEACDCYEHMMRHFPNTRVVPLYERWFNTKLLLATSKQAM
ncbi:Flp pilus assembly protein TadD%2C contains TPR repeats [Bordetella ansorpii]|uniref:Flp pilus assembly protein TadD, contains TPR repeats n=1 Tax=Bordetella ansorpii TaxID=288768 RepID=A0A157SWM6_9BORD|nr:polysialyltransferase family glycosyltransferase [Bordetella ansorpii]SAI74839.1 Flp pilus assembly protein TadD%2C contains TPR repeats [Bordetella ansorpii]